MSRDAATTRIFRPAVLLIAVLPMLAAFTATPAAAERAVKIPPPAQSVAAPGGGLQTTVLAGGCFWGIQAVFQHVKGVVSAVVRLCRRRRRGCRL